MRVGFALSVCILRHYKWVQYIYIQNQELSKCSVKIHWQTTYV